MHFYVFCSVSWYNKNKISIGLISRMTSFAGIDIPPFRRQRGGFIHEVSNRCL